MPVSDYHCISDVLDIVEQAKPTSVLDVGCGFGKWGVLCREVLDIYHGNLAKTDWKARIEGVEIYEPYRNPNWEYAYNAVHVMDVFALLGQGKRYDLILCCDVIEHFEKNVGQRLLDQMLDHAKAVIIVTPRGFFPQDPTYGNDHEEHKSGWEESDFAAYPHLYKVIGFTFMVVLSRDPATLARLKLRHPFDVLGVKKGALELARFSLHRVKRRLKPETST
jgi:SAM-dependent methyltransferase